MPAEFRSLDGKKLLTAVTMHIAGKKRVHLGGVSADRKAVGITSGNPAVAAGVLTALFDGPKGIWTVDLSAQSIGRVDLTATLAASGRVPATTATLGITVVASVTIAGADTNEGLLVRLFLAETRNPGEADFIRADAKTVMQRMKLVLDTA